jgi:hypothetical protein
MYKKQAQEPAVIYEPVIQNEKIAKDRLDIAFDILFEEVFRIWQMDYQNTKNGKPEYEFGNYEPHGIS